MNPRILVIIISCLLLMDISLASPIKSIKKNKKSVKSLNHRAKLLLEKYKKNHKSNKSLVTLKKDTLNLSGAAVPVLIEVMKNGKFPEKNRWVATFLLGQIMGKKASPFISKFIKHPNWVMRMAALKTLLALKEKKFSGLYAEALKDRSLIVRTQALENISRLNLQHLSSNVWAMLYDKKNYYYASKKHKRGNIIKKVIRAIGDLKFHAAKRPLLKMVQKKKYDDIFNDIDYSLTKITGKDSPKGNKKVKRIFWSRLSLANKVIK